MSPEVETPHEHQQAKIIVGFPGIGKSTLTREAAMGKYTKWNVKQILDEPNYAKGKEDTFLAGLLELAKEPETVLLLPAHRFIGDFLVEKGFAFSSVYPKHSAKKEYHDRYVNRGSHPRLIELVDSQWDQFVVNMNYDQGKCNHFELREGQFLDDIFLAILTKRENSGPPGPKAVQSGGT